MKETVIVIGYETSYLEYKIKSLGYNVFPINYFSKKNLWKNLNITNLEKISRDLKKTSKKNVPKIDFGLRFGLPKPAQIDPTSKKTKKTLSKKSKKKQLPEIKYSHRKASLLRPRRTIQPSFQ